MSYARDIIVEVIQKLKQRNKLIRLADTSERGWDTVKQYKSNPVESDYASVRFGTLASDLEFKFAYNIK